MPFAVSTLKAYYFPTNVLLIFLCHGDSTFISEVANIYVLMELNCGCTVLVTRKYSPCYQHENSEMLEDRSEARRLFVGSRSGHRLWTRLHCQRPDPLQNFAVQRKT